MVGSGHSIWVGRGMLAPETGGTEVETPSCHTSIQRGCRLVPKCIDYSNNTGVVPILLMYYYSPLRTY